MFEGPLDRLAREAIAGARASPRGKGAEAVDAAVRRALRETVFRFDLVLRIIVTAHELLEREVLIDAALSAHVALLTSMDAKTCRSDPTHQRRLASIRDALTVRVRELQAAQVARETVEARYLAGHPALFPDAVRAWTEQIRTTETLAGFAVRLAELDGVPSAEPADPDAVPTRTTQLVADLVEPAKATALEKLGDGERSFAIAADWLRAKLPSPAIGVPER